MSDVLKFDPNRKKSIEKKSKKPAPDKTPKMTRETYHLWRMSEAIDDVIRDAVLNHKLDPKEVAAVLAHRLGNVIKMTDDPQLLLDFCEKLIERLNTPPEGDPHSTAS